MKCSFLGLNEQTIDWAIDSLDSIAPHSITIMSWSITTLLNGLLAVDDTSAGVGPGGADFFLTFPF